MGSPGKGLGRMQRTWCARNIDTKYTPSEANARGLFVHGRRASNSPRVRSPRAPGRIFDDLKLVPNGAELGVSSSLKNPARYSSVESAPKYSL